MQTTDVRDAAQYAMNQGKSFLEKQVDDRTHQIGQQIGSVAQELRTVGSHLRESGPVGIAAGYVEQAADVVDRLGSYLQDADSERLIADLESIARQNPWGIAAGSVLIGFAASRFLKTSSARRYRESAGREAEQGSYGTMGYDGSAYGETDYAERGMGGGMSSGGGRYAT